MDEWAASNMSWHRLLWDSIGSLVGWIDGRIGARTVSANSFAAAYACGAHLAYDRMPKGPQADWQADKGLLDGTMHFVEGRP